MLSPQLYVANDSSFLLSSLCSENIFHVRRQHISYEDNRLTLQEYHVSKGDSTPV